MNHRKGAAEIDRRNASLLVRCDCKHQRYQHAGATADNDGGNECRQCECSLFTAPAQAVRP